MSDSVKKKVDMDTIDRRLLIELLRDARSSLRRLSEEMNVSPATLHNRLTRLVQEGIIKGFTALIDYSKLGYTLSAVIMAKVDGKHLVEFEREVANADNVVAVYDVVGEYDVVLIAKFRSVEDLDAFLKQLLKNPKVERTYTSIVLNVVKEDPRVKI
ncbi:MULTISPECIES: Lrp/AsnC family transcriptional regulator [Acidianus]|jgi:DNA-binding Lrp family transcriptional regulator|uniref:Winged helix-turn-helix transcriptional regulator n=4 Tax=Acidianus TaxID=12914 RepID=A0A650CS92_ACIAM|nr:MULTISPECIES: Lrp/AsnC family transcriptional regulator [Acidianus]PVU75682.1 Lrp/AsnC family transcriptional regulator [Acidianus hospitalis]AEE94021.1 transcriptional regulator, AsnC family [Acidianus hospitalis W1]MQL55128.1 winged helix-turn-helix transcriptional regulator [Acidianus ambivalens]MUM64144.1 winged helix-turn-helix transcriptional regulator [Acidianus infernus]QGR20679.1 winged helix-turn-helix transcriptional regulator [Acidianus ambivalens]